MYLFLSYKVIKKIYQIKDHNIKLILVGTISIILLQSFIHIGVNIRLLPTTGMTLPFLSYGGSSIISSYNFRNYFKFNKKKNINEKILIVTGGSGVM